MGAPTAAPAAARPYPGRWYIVLGVALALLGPILYGVQVLWGRHLTTPWYLPALGTAGAGLLVAALVRARSSWRLAGALLLLLLAGAEWYFLVVFTKLPPYAGPVVEGKAFPAFATTLADGTPFSQDNLKGEQDTVMVFFRGRW